MRRLPAAWKSLIIAGLTMTVQNGVLLTFPLIYVDFLEEFGWGRGEAAGIYSVTTVMIGLAGPLTGLLLDRFGPRRLFVGGALVTAAGMAAASRAGSLLQLYLTYGFLTGIGNSALTSTPNMVVVSKWFPRSTGRAIAIADIGTGLGVLIIVPAAQWLILRLGWRGALFSLALFVAGVLVPANWVQRVPGEGDAIDETGEGASPPEVGAAERGLTLRGAVAAPEFWWLALVRLSSGMAFQVITVHLVAYIVGTGYGKMTAASIVGLASMASMLGRYLVGVGTDRLGRGRTMTLAYCSTALGILAVMTLESAGPVALAAFIVFYGLSQGSAGIVVAARAADLFQGSCFGQINGWISLGNGLGEGVGSWLGGAVHDRTGSYQPAFAAAILALVLAVGSMSRTYARAMSVWASKRT